MLSMWFKAAVCIIAGLHFATSNFEEFLENEDPFSEDVISHDNSTNKDVTTREVANHTAFFHGIRKITGTFAKNVETILPKLLPHFESTTRRPQDISIRSFVTQLPGGPPQGSIIGQSVSTLLRLPYEGARTAKDLLLPKSITGSPEGGLWDRNVDPSKEHGNMERFGREFVKKIATAFGRTDTQGLDTNSTFFSGVMDSFKEYVRFIYPGTVWCGEGDIAGKSTELGVFAEPDKCCRAHDKCNNIIEKGEHKYGLENTGMFTRSHCSCDRNFLKCLKDSKSAVGLQIGITYFSVLGPQCFEVQQQIVGCDKTIKARCVQYNFSSDKQMKYQWFDNPTF